MTHDTQGSIAHRNLPMLLLQAREKIMLRFRPLLTARGVTEQQWRVIRALHEQGPLEPRQISELCTISSPSLAGVLARMEGVELIRKQRFPNDQRRVLVSLASPGEALVEHISRDLEMKYGEIERLVGIETLASVYRAVDRLLEGLGDECATDDVPPMNASEGV